MPPRASPPSNPSGSGAAESDPEALAFAVADRLHSAAIHLLRSARREDPASGLSPARLSALSVVVFAGPLSLGELAAAEQVRPPTMSRLVAALVDAGLLEREADPADGRVTRLLATAAGRRILAAGRRRRVAYLAALLGGLDAADLATLAAAAELLTGLFQRPG
jgi:DNA-binding MarR family transcriptional regulator